MIGAARRAARTRRAIIGALVVLIVVVAGCSGGSGGDPVGEGSSATEPPRAEPPVDCTSVSTGTADLAVDAGGAEHQVRVHVPTTYAGTFQLPLVLNFHGFGSNGEQQAALTGFEALADEEGFVVAHPTGVPASNGGTGLNSWELADVDDPAKDDLAFTNELLDLLIEDYCVDENRVYATGMSGGGLFTSRLVCDMSDRIAAASSVAALAFSETCDPARPVPFMAIHGTEDDRVPFDGDLSGTWFEGQDFAKVLFSQPIPEQFAEFAGVMGCDPDGERVQESTDIYVTTYSGCDDDVPLRFYEVTDGGHAWPSSPLAEMLADFQGYITFDIDATADAWDFFEQHSLGA